MEKEKLVFVEPTSYIVAKFEYGNFIVEVESDTGDNVSLIWIRHKQYIVKVAMGCCRGGHFCDCQGCVDTMKEIILENIDERIDEYMKLYVE